MLGLSYTISLSPRLESDLVTLFTPSPSRVGHPGDPYTIHIVGVGDEVLVPCVREISRFSFFFLLTVMRLADIFMCKCCRGAADDTGFVGIIAHLRTTCEIRASCWEAVGVGDEVLVPREISRSSFFAFDCDEVSRYFYM